MTKILKPAILILLCFLLHEGASGQIRTNVTNYLRQQFLSYCEAVPREEIYVHSDRDEYIAGEDLWFNLYLTDRQSFKPSSDSRIVYFELLNPENRPVVQKRISVENGFGPGQIVIPDTLSTGIYTVRAYTNWMKNFLPYNCFMKDIRVYNAFSTKAFKGKKLNGNIVNGKGRDSEQGFINAGVTLNVNNLSPDILEIYVSADEKFRSENNNLLYLFIQTLGKINHTSTERMSGENTKITIPKSLLSAGINQITIFNAKGQPVCERYIYTPDKKEELLILHSVDSCNIRDRISLEIDLDNEVLSLWNSTNISISVASEAEVHSGIDINEYLVFGSEYGFQPFKALNGRKITEMKPEFIDSLLSTVKSSWINWETILSGELPVFKYRKEKEEHYLSGKLLTSDQKPAGSDEFLLLSSPGKTASFQYASTNNEGNFNFRIPVDEEVKDLIIQPEVVTDNRKIIIESSFSDQYLHSEILIDSSDTHVPAYISDWSVNYQVMKIYESSSLGELLARNYPEPVQKRFYGKPEIELIMDDYIKLPVMEEVFFELVPGVLLKNRKSVYEITVMDPIENKIYPIGPGMLIDGVIINDPSVIARLDPELVEKIDVTREKYFIGDYLFFGIVNIITRAGDFSSVTLPGYAVRLPYRVLDRVWSFMSPDYSSETKHNSRTPDFRNTLYWNPSVKPDNSGKAEIEFWSSDVISDYEVKIQGMTSEGKSFSVKKIIKVR